MSAPQKNNDLTEEEQKMQRLYGKIPNKKDLLNHKLKDRKYFDSGDYALSKAGKSTTVGSSHPTPESIPHSNPQTNNQAVKESNLVSKEKNNE